LDALAASGVRHTVLNTAWLGEQLPSQLGNSHQGMALSYSMEGRDFGGALETAGGIARALPRLAEVFWVLAGDVYAPGFVFDPTQVAAFTASPALAHLWLVPNPAHNPRGDFGLAPDGQALNLPANDPAPRYTYSTIGLYKRAFFEPPLCPIPPGNPEGVRAALGPLLRAAMDRDLVTATLYTGPWTDVGTPERLAGLNADVTTNHPIPQ
jgi:MurNAc alpha-1-phosphate uridylyltransferase